MKALAAEIAPQPAKTRTHVPMTWSRMDLPSRLPEAVPSTSR